MNAAPSIAFPLEGQLIRYRPPWVHPEATPYFGRIISVRSRQKVDIVWYSQSGREVKLVNLWYYVGNGKKREQGTYCTPVE